MIDDARSMPADSLHEADVCIVGSGPAGIALSRELVGRGLSVVLLESGGFQLEAATQDLNKADVTGLPITGHVDGRGRSLGGTGQLWAGQCVPLDPIDFEERSWVPHSGWPLSPGEMRPFLRRAERFFKVEGETYDERTYERFGLEAPAWSPSMLRTMFTVYTPEVSTGAHHAAFLRSSPQVRVVLHATVVEVETDSTGREVSGVVFATAGGTRGRAHAPVVVLCAGGLENARLLLASRAVKPSGLGNDRDLVGRFFQDHPNGVTATLRDVRQGIQGRFRLLYKGGRRYFPKFALTEAAQRREQLLNCNAHLVFEYPEESGIAALQQVVRALRVRALPPQPLSQLRRILLNTPEIAGAVARRVRGASPDGQPSSVRLQCHVEQVPDPECRVTLNYAARDASGLPRLRLHWRMDERERRTIRAMTQIAAAEFARLEIGVLEPHPWLEEDGGWREHLRDSYHHAGTTRMAHDALRGVVDTDCQVFGTSGLYSCGGAVFPTSGYANPTLMIVALAIRLADHLATRKRSHTGGLAAGAQPAKVGS